MDRLPKSRNGRIALAVVVLLLVWAVFGRGGGGGTTTPTQEAAAPAVDEPAVEPADTDEPAATEAPAATDTPEPTEDPNSFEDGKWLVGTDVQPGIYRTDNAGGSCYWARLSGLSGELGDLLANDNASGPAIVEIAATDAAFESTRCGTWHLDSGAGGDAATTFGDGTFMVGRDIAPGQYRNDGAGSCYWSRLSGFSGELGTIIANDNADGSTIVEIAPGDAGFRSTRCGTWSQLP